MVSQQTLPHPPPPSSIARIVATPDDAPGVPATRTSGSSPLIRHELARFLEHNVALADPGNHLPRRDPTRSCDTPGAGILQSSRRT
ncbi:unnamed protein product [Hyaloperonospora brassicae]|uniref:RxLR effector candidate protein n=1 Tax=Hyaloperonospora brassicae TaxID=162125 RepID=A0AAV0SY83_HYABA|nr:unnamed protein product [Hyaloperonospora brassicae]